MQVLAFSTSSSPTSINRNLVMMAVSELEYQLGESVQLETIDMNDYELPLYTQAREGESGIPAQAQEFFAKIGAADALIMGLPEHNGYYPAVYKNLFDWTSRHNQAFYQNKPTLLVSTSPGPGGAASVLNIAAQSAPYFAMDVRGTLSVPSYFDAVNMETGSFNDAAVTAQLAEQVRALLA